MMLKKILLMVLSVYSTSTLAQVIATPSFYDFGSVKSGYMATAWINFQNLSNENISFFNVNCNGDLSAFMCNSNCFQLQPYGSCSVQVQFMPRNGDGLRRWLMIQGFGGGAFATANVQGIDAK